MRGNIPFFSIIIPCYNAVDYIGETLFSLEMQSFSDFEVILVDDCSIDGTFEYCKEHISNYKYSITLLQNNKNSGPGVARNFGMQYAKGEYVGFCDSDDWYEPDLLNIVYMEIEKKTADIIFFDLYRCFSNGSKVVINYLSNFTNDMSKEDYIALATDSLCSIIVRKDVFRKVSIANLYNAEDTVTIPLLVSESERFSFLPIPLYNYRYRSNSLSTKANKRIVDDFWNAYLLLNTYTTSNNFSAFEFQSLKLVVYGVLYNAIRCNLNINFLKKKMEEFQSLYPNWYHNKYIISFPLRKKVWMFCVKRRLYFALYIYCKLQYLYMKIRQL